MAGLAETRGHGPDTFWTWRETMYRFALMMTPDDVEAVAAELYVEMLEAGFAAVAEFHYLHHAPDGAPYADRAEMAGRIVAAAREAGIGLTLLPVFYAHARFRRGAAEAGTAPVHHRPRRLRSPVRGLRRAGRRKAGRGARRRAAQPARGHAGGTRRRRRARGGRPIHIHAAEQVAEVEDCVAALGARPVRWLLDHAGVGPRWCLVHATHMDAGETRDLAASGAVAGLCPVTEANLGDGIFQGRAWLDAGGRFGVGTDSNVSIGAADELRQLEYSQRLGARSRNVLADAGGSTGRRLIDAALTGGAQALARRSGALAVGARADLLTLDAGSPDARGQDRRRDPRRLDFQRRKRAYRLRLERRPQARAGRPARLAGADRGALRRDHAPALGALMRRRARAGLSGKGAGIDPPLQFRVRPMNGR